MVARASCVRAKFIRPTMLLLGLFGSLCIAEFLPAQSPTQVPTELPKSATKTAETITAKPPKKRVDGPMRARLIAALAGIVIFGFCIVGLAWLSGRMTRRMLKTNEEQRQRYLTTEQLTRDDWADKPLTYDERQRIFHGRT